MSILQSKTNRSNSDFSFIKKAYDFWDYPFLDVNNKNHHNAQYISVMQQMKTKRFCVQNHSLLF